MKQKYLEHTTSSIRPEKWTKQLRIGAENHLQKKTWSNFKSFFTSGYEDYKEDVQDIIVGGYRAIAVQEETYQALKKLQESIRKDEVTIQDLQAQNNSLMAQMGTKIWVWRNKRFIQTNEKFSQHIKGGFTTKLTKMHQNEKYFSYFCSHGKTGVTEHTSKTCQHQKKGH